ncbi:MAG TPA: hypothetical protein VK338_03615, partial [Candidatus Nitrosocosmicus sp.]|nr:hypothetical protein [Candidatus Nitrosocosmicus sp.]
MLKTLTIITIIFSVTIFSSLFYSKNKTEELLTNKPTTKSYWFILHRKSNQEMLYHGNPGDIEHSKLIKTFKVKTGIPGKRPTPLPHLLGREYWIIIKKERVENNPETAP